MQSRLVLFEQIFHANFGKRMKKKLFVTFLSSDLVNQTTSLQLHSRL